MTRDASGPGEDRGPAPARPGLYFDAVLQPNRSLPPRGFLLLMAVLVAVSLAVGIAFLLAGAWPVFGFLGLDILIVWLAFRASYRSGTLRERLRLSSRALDVERTWPDGRTQRWRMAPGWLRVAIDEPPEHHSQLTLSSHGRTLTVGSFLAPEERAEVANALRAALVRCRSGAPPQPA